MEEEIKLSDLFNEITDVIGKEGDIESTEELKNILKILKDKNLLEEEIDTWKISIFSKCDKFDIEKKYILDFLLMCEALLTDKNPNINENNIERLYEFKQSGIVSFWENNGEILDCICTNKILLKSKYDKLDYKAGGELNNGTTINNNGPDFAGSTINNSGIISGGNSTNNLENKITITNENIEDVVKAIHTLILNDINISENLKNELLENRKDTSKLKNILTNIGTFTSNIAVGVLTQACISQLGL